MEIFSEIFDIQDQITVHRLKLDGLSHDELRAVSSAQIAILHRTSSGEQLKQKKKERWIKIEF